MKEKVCFYCGKNIEANQDCMVKKEYSLTSCEVYSCCLHIEYDNLWKKVEKSVFEVTDSCCRHCRGSLIEGNDYLFYTGNLFCGDSCLVQWLVRMGRIKNVEIETSVKVTVK